MPRRQPLPVALIGAPFRSREVSDWGVPRKRLEARDVTQPYRGVSSVRGTPDNVRDRADAFAPLLPAGAAFSHATAAMLLGAPLPRSLQRDPRLHVITPGTAAQIRRKGVVGHRADSIAVVVRDGLPVVAPAHVFAQLGTMLGHDDLVAVGDFLVTPNRRARTPALADISALAGAIEPGARGAARARSALRDVRVGAESPMETRLRLLLMRAGLPEPLLNPAIRIGDQTLHPDLLFPRWRVAIEYEGEQHRTDERQWRHDIWRREVFEDAGWRQVRVTSDDVLKHPDQLLARVCRVLAKRAAGG